MLTAVTTLQQMLSASDTEGQLVDDVRILIILVVATIVSAVWSAAMLWSSCIEQGKMSKVSIFSVLIPLGLTVTCLIKYQDLSNTLVELAA